MVLIKDNDPKKLVTDQLVLNQMANVGLYPDEVEFTQDYALRGKESSPYTKHYRSLKTADRFMVSSGLPRVDFQGKPVSPVWQSEVSGYRVRQIFECLATPDGLITAGCLNNQSDGRQVNQIARWQPTLYLNGKEVKAGNFKLLEVDPINPNYQNNILEWDYGICKRWLRNIEGRILGSWVFSSNPGGDVRIVYNQSGDFPVNLHQFGINPNEEFIPKTIFDNPIIAGLRNYPIVIEDSQTFYPDIASGYVDGRVRRLSANEDWATIKNGAGTQATTGLTYMDIFFEWGTTCWTIFARTYTLFDTSPLTALANLLSGTFSLYYNDKLADAFTPTLCVYSAVPNADFQLVTDDYGIALFGTTPFTGLFTYSGFGAGYNTVNLTAAGLAAVSKISITHFGQRESVYDAGSSTPSNPPAATKDSYFQYKTSNAGAGYQPKLIIVYSFGSYLSAKLKRVHINKRAFSPQDIQKHYLLTK